MGGDDERGKTPIRVTHARRAVPRTAAVPGRTKDGRSSAPPATPPPPPAAPTPRDDVSAALAMVGAPRVRLDDPKKKDKPQTAKQALAQRAESPRPLQKTRPPTIDEDAAIDAAMLDDANGNVADHDGAAPRRDASDASVGEALAGNVSMEEDVADGIGLQNGLWTRVKGWFGGAR